MASRDLNVSALVVASTVIACTFAATPVATTVLRPISSVDKQLTVLSDGPYVEQMSAALASAGFDVVGYALPGRPLKTSYGFRFTMELGQTVCAFTPNVIGNASLTLVDLRSGETVANFRQRGAAGPCTSVDPVFPGLATEARRVWGVK